MIKVYFKQAWELLKRNKLFSTLYILGTGLSIAMTMIVAIVYYIRIAPVYPEENRNRTLVLKYAIATRDDNFNTAGLSYELVNNWLYPLKSAEAVTGVMDVNNNVSYLQLDGNAGEVPAYVKYTDEQFFKVFPFIFLEGKPFTEADRVSGIRNAVITDSYARKVFGTSEGIVGKNISVDFVNTKIVGVVKGGSFLTKDSYGQIYLPYSCIANYNKNFDCWALGSFHAYMLAKSTSDVDKVHNEVDELLRKYNSSITKDGWKLNFKDQPDVYWHSTFRYYTNQGVNWKAVTLTLLGTLLILLWVPALNLSGMISARMDRRLPEMGVRKAFGANRSLLLKQIVWENLLLSGLGALLGLVIAWIALCITGYATFSLFEPWPTDVIVNDDIWFGMDMLFAPLVFILTVVFCVFLNLLSALLPAWHALKRPIVSSLNELK